MFIAEIRERGSTDHRSKIDLESQKYSLCYVCDYQGETKVVNDHFLWINKSESVAHICRQLEYRLFLIFWANFLAK